jgi:hypothetical protein
MRSTFVLVAMVILASLQASSVTMRGAGGQPVRWQWKLISIETRGPDGAIAPGPNPVGGVNPNRDRDVRCRRECLAPIMPSGRPASLNILQPLSPEQARRRCSAISRITATYTLDQRTRTMHIHFDGSLNPSIVGTNGSATTEFNGNRMKFRAGPTRRCRGNGSGDMDRPGYPTSVIAEQVAVLLLFHG